MNPHSKKFKKSSSDSSEEIEWQQMKRNDDFIDFAYPKILVDNSSKVKNEDVDSENKVSEKKDDILKIDQVDPSSEKNMGKKYVEFIDNSIEENKPSDFSTLFKLVEVGIDGNEVILVNHKHELDEISQNLIAYDVSDRCLIAMDSAGTKMFDDAIHICAISDDGVRVDDTSDLDNVNIFEVGIHVHNAILLPGLYGQFTNILVEGRKDILFTVVLRYIRKNGEFHKEFAVLTEAYGYLSMTCSFNDYESIAREPNPETIKTYSTLPKETLDYLLRIKGILKIIGDIEGVDIVNPVNYFGIEFSNYVSQIINKNYRGYAITIEPQQYNSQTKSYNNLVSFRSPHRKVASYFTMKQFYAMKIYIKKIEEMTQFLANCTPKEFEDLKKYLKNENKYVSEIENFIQAHFDELELQAEKDVILCILSNANRKKN